jgi:hypothetical protein
MERVLDLMYNDLAMSSLAVQFGLIGIVAVVAGLVWHGLTHGVQGRQQFQLVAARRR